MADDSEHDKSQEQDTGPQGTRVFRREELEQRLAEREREVGPSTATTSGAQLLGLAGAFKGRRFNIPNGRSTLGRDNQNDIIINDDSVSLVHARLIEKEGQFRVLNLLSTNGTWVNNKKVTDSALQDGDSVCFGEAEFLFQQKPAVPLSSGSLWRKLRRWFGA